MRQLGLNGRFGNQLLQYAFLRLYAASHGLTPQTPDWIGRDLFACNDPLADTPLPGIDENQADLVASLNGHGPVFANHDLAGYFCHHTRVWEGRAADFRALFKPAPRLDTILHDAMSRLRKRGKTLVAIHLRRGDFGYGPFWIAPAAWYRAWLDTIWAGLDAPVLYIASDDPLAAAEFRRFGALSAADLGVDIPGAEFYLDHYILSHADHLAISNSTFSFTAAMLSETGGTCVRPDPDQRALAGFDPWHADVLLQADPALRRYAPDDIAAMTRWIGPRGFLVHVGRFCADWTVWLRRRHPQLRILEISDQDSVDGIRPPGGLQHINHLIIEEVAALDRVLDASAQAIRQARIDVIHFRGNPAAASREMLEGSGYRLFAVQGDALLPLAPALADTPNPRLAIQDRLLARHQAGLS